MHCALCEILAQRGRILPDFVNAELVVWIWRRNQFIICLLLQTFLSSPPCSSEPSAPLCLGALLPSWFLLAEITCLNMAQDMSWEYSMPFSSLYSFFKKKPRNPQTKTQHCENDVHTVSHKQWSNVIQAMNGFGKPAGTARAPFSLWWELPQRTNMDVSFPFLGSKARGIQ